MKKQSEQLTGKGYWSLVWRQFRKNRHAVVALWVIVFLFLIAIFSGFIGNDRPILLKYRGKFYIPALYTPGQLRAMDFAKLRTELEDGDWAVWPPIPYGPKQINLDEFLEAPNGKHLLGTDDTGRDVLSRMIHGTKVSLTVGFVAVSIYVVIGVILGSLAGYYGGVVDTGISRLIEVMICFPTFFLILTLIALLPPSIYNIMIAIGITGWPGVARLIRGEILKQKQQEYVLAGQALGVRSAKLIFRQILPNAIAPVLVSATFGIAAAILTESSLSYLGFGVPPPTPSWGDILSKSREYTDIAWWLVLFPGLAIFITITAYNLVGEGLRDAIDPRLKD